MNRGLVAGAVLCAALVSGGMLIQSGTWQEASASPGTPRLLEQVFGHIQRDFIDTVPMDVMYRRAATGFVRELDDPYTALLSPDALGRMREDATGRYAGIGIEIDVRDGFVTVIAPIAGSPADSAGIRPGDRILKVDTTATVGLSLDEVQQALRGPAGTSVSLIIERAEVEIPTLTLRRRQIAYHPVQRRLVAQNGIGYVELATFSESAAIELRRAVDSLRAAGARSLILDLRGNPGGLLEQGVAVADLFLGEGVTLASTRGRTPEANQEFTDQARERWPAMPLVVLVDSGTASAAEIVAGAVQDHGRAVLVGAPTYGKGSAQNVFPVTGGLGLKLTTARWFTPKGRSIERDSSGAGGISPDVPVVPETSGIAPATPIVDPVVARALRLLEGVSTPDELRARAKRVL